MQAEAGPSRINGGGGGGGEGGRYQPTRLVSSRGEDLLQSYLLPPSQTLLSTISGTQDLLSLFNLLPLYDSYVRPYIPPPPAPGPVEKEKGKGMTIVVGGVRIGSTEELKKEKEKKVKIPKNYAAIIADIPGRNTIKKDLRGLTDVVMNPDLQEPLFHPFDAQTLREAFTLNPGQIPGFDPLVWETNTEGKKEKKKKKRKLEGDGGSTAGNSGNDEELRKKKKRKAEGENSRGTPGRNTPA